MASNYYYLNNYRGAGKIGISRHAFESMARIATSTVEGASVKGHRKGRKYSLAAPVRASFRKDGKVELSIRVSMKKGTNVKETSRLIQEKVASAVSIMSEAVPFGVDIKVVSIG